MNNLSLIGYALLCIIAPVLWGLLIVRASYHVERRLAKRRKDEDGSAASPVPPIEYHI